MNNREYQNMFNLEDSHFIYRSTHHNVLQLLARYWTNKNGSKILDAGCGTGLLMQKLKSAGRVYGVDTNSQALKFCKKRGLKNIRRASINKLPYQANSFDIVTSIDVIYHRDVDDKKALSEFSRILKPEGLLLLKVPAHQYLKGKHDKYVHTRYRYSKIEIQNLLINNNFEIIFISYGHLLIFPIVFIKRFLERFSDKNSNSDVVMPTQLLNLLLINLARIETQLMLKFGLPYGISLYAVAKKMKQNI